jgi:hypothetical protein
VIPGRLVAALITFTSLMSSVGCASERGGSTASELPYSASLSKRLLQTSDFLTTDEGNCLGRETIRSIGIEALDRMGVEADDLERGLFESRVLANLSEEQAGDLGEVWFSGRCFDVALFSSPLWFETDEADLDSCMWREMATELSENQQLQRTMGVIAFVPDSSAQDFYEDFPEIDASVSAICGLPTLASAIQAEAQDYIESFELASEAGYFFTAAACVKPTSVKIGTQFECTAVDDEGDGWTFTVEVSGHKEITIVAAEVSN